MWFNDLGIQNPYYGDDTVVIVLGDCRQVLPLITPNSITAVVTDPPYALTENKRGGTGVKSVNLNTPAGRARITTGFMGKVWDNDVAFQMETWKPALDVCKPGAFLLSFGGTRTYHRMACAIEDAGFEIRDMIEWMYGSGFPKSLDVSKAIDRAAGVDREDKFEGSFERHAGPTGNKRCPKCGKWLISGNPCQCPRPQDIAVTPKAKQWSGYGTALKPSHEPICMAHKPIEGTVAENVLKWGTGGLNIDECRVEGNKGDGVWGTSNATINTDRKFNSSPDMQTYRSQQHPLGRFPANLIHDGSDEVVALFPQSEGQQGDVKGSEPSHTGDENTHCYGEYGRIPAEKRGDTGSAARFFYCAKASKSERDAGIEGIESEMGHNRFDTCATCGGYILQNPDRPSACHCEHPVRVHNSVRGNTHPTVKPLSLMVWLITLASPPNSVILDPFMGSGTTLIAARKLGRKCIGIEIEEKYCEIAVKRLSQGVLL